MAHRALILALAEQRGLGVSTLIREALQPYIVIADASVDKRRESPLSIAARPTLAPANRAIEEAPSAMTKRSGFTEKMK